MKTKSLFQVDLDYGSLLTEDAEAVADLIRVLDRFERARTWGSPFVLAKVTYNVRAHENVEVAEDQEERDRHDAERKAAAEAAAAQAAADADALAAESEEV